MFKDTKAHMVTIGDGQPSLRTGKAVPKGAVNLAYYNNPKLSPIENVSISDTSKLIIENIAQEQNRELIMYPNTSGMLEVGPVSALPSVHFEITNRFKDGKPLYYCYKLNKLHYEKSTDYQKAYNDKSIRLTKQNGKPLYGSKYKYIIELIQSNEHPYMYEIMIYTSFTTTNANKIQCIYNAIELKEGGKYDIIPEYCEKISPQPFFKLGHDYIKRYADSSIVRSNTIHVKNYNEIQDTRDKYEFKYRIKTSTGLESYPINGYAVHKDRALPHELSAFIGYSMRVSPRKGAFFMSAKDLLIAYPKSSLNNQDLDNCTYYAEIITGKNLNISVDPDGKKPPAVEVPKASGPVINLPEIYKETRKGVYVSGYAVKMKDHRQIMIKHPLDSKVLQNWYLRIQYGVFQTNGTLKNGTKTKLTYTIPEYTRQSYSFELGEPYIEVRKETPTIINNHLIKVKYTPIYVDTINYRTPRNLKVWKCTDLENVELKVISWNDKEGLIEIANVISKNDNIIVDYVYEQECYVYRGYHTKINESDITVSLDMNPNKYHSYDRPIYDLNNNVINFIDSESYNLFNSTVHVFMRPSVVQDEYGGILHKNETVLYHKFSAEPAKSTDILIGKVYLRHNTTLNNMNLIDTRKRGGGIVEDMDDDIRKKIEPESDYYFDIGYWDGKPYNENSVVIVRIDNRILKENGGRMSKQDVESAVSKWYAYGTLPIIEFMETFSEDNSANATLMIEKSHINKIDMIPSFVCESVNIVSKAKTDIYQFYNNYEACGIIKLFEPKTDERFFITHSRNKVTIPNSIVDVVSCNSVLTPYCHLTMYDQETNNKNDENDVLLLETKKMDLPVVNTSHTKNVETPVIKINPTSIK